MSDGSLKAFQIDHHYEYLNVFTKFVNTSEIVSLNLSSSLVFLLIEVFSGFVQEMVGCCEQGEAAFICGVML